MADLRAQIHSAVDLLAGPPFGPLFRALIGEAQQKTARDQGQVSPDFDLALAMAILSGPPYFQLVITQEPLTHAYVDRILDAFSPGSAHIDEQQQARARLAVEDQ